MTNLDGTSDEKNLVVDTPAFAASPSTNPCLVYLNMFPRLAADTILIGPHHASAELVHAEGRLKKLAKTRAQRRIWLRSMTVPTTLATAQDTGPVCGRDRLRHGKGMLSNTC